MQSTTGAPTEIYFTDFFKVEPDILEEYGAFNVSLVYDLPLFVDPFLLFNSDSEVYQRLHEQMIDYVPGTLRQLGLEKNNDVILIDGRADNKPSGSEA